MKLSVRDEDAMKRLGASLARGSSTGGVIFLIGELGSGKTTLVRGLLRALGHKAAVRSPTFTLIEPYELSQHTVFHFDLYRLADPEELEYLGVRDYLHDEVLCVVEWPERGEGVLPEPDLVVTIEYEDGARSVELLARSPRGEHMLRAFKNDHKL